VDSGIINSESGELLKEDDLDDNGNDSGNEDPDP
jgi:hypothetical protein